MKYKIELTLTEMRRLRVLLLSDMIMSENRKKRDYNLYCKLNVFEKELKK